MDKLRAYIESKKISQAALAELIGVKQPTVSDWLNGNMLPSAANLRTLSRVTGISVDDLIAEKPKRPPSRSANRPAA